MNQHPNQPQQEYPQWQQPNTQYPPQQFQPQQPWQQPPQVRPVRMQVKVVCLIIFGLAFVLAGMGVPFLTLIAGFLLVTCFILIFLI